MQAPNRIRHALRKDLTKGVSTYASRCKAHACVRGGNQLPPVLEGAAPLTAACPSLEGRAGVGWVRQPGRGKRRDPVPQTMLGPLPRALTAFAL